MREITVYNTMTRQKEVFNPVTPGEAKMYVCGVTPYNHPHIGNARPFVTWDVIRRYMKHVGYKWTLLAFNGLIFIHVFLRISKISSR